MLHVMSSPLKLIAIPFIAARFGWEMAFIIIGAPISTVTTERQYLVIFKCPIILTGYF